MNAHDFDHHLAHVERRRRHISRERQIIVGLAVASVVLSLLAVIVQVVA